jgi:hypothetical protein
MHSIATLTLLPSDAVDFMQVYAQQMQLTMNEASHSPSVGSTNSNVATVTSSGQGYSGSGAAQLRPSVTIGYSGSASGAAQLRPSITIGQLLHPPSNWTIAKLVYADGGVRAFYRGLSAAALRAFPANAALFWGVNVMEGALSSVGYM